MLAEDYDPVDAIDDLRSDLDRANSQLEEAWALLRGLYAEGVLDDEGIERIELLAEDHEREL